MYGELLPCSDGTFKLSNIMFDREDIEQVIVLICINWPILHFLCQYCLRYALALCRPTLSTK